MVVARVVVCIVRALRKEWLSLLLGSSGQDEDEEMAVLGGRGMRTLQARWRSPASPTSERRWDQGRPPRVECRFQHGQKFGVQAGRVDGVGFASFVCRRGGRGSRRSGEIGGEG